MSDAELWPVRNVSEYAYCPRLFYYMQVEGAFLPSADTEQGVAVHRRVDRPSAAVETPDDDESEEKADPQRPRSVRSLVLTSGRLRLTATLDLAEISSKTAVPVEHRKSRPDGATLAPPPEDPGEVEPPRSTVRSRGRRIACSSACKCWHFSRRAEQGGDHTTMLSGVL